MSVVSGKGWTMHLGDCREVLPTLAPVDALVTDPPYGIDLGDASAPRDCGGLLRTGHGRARKGHGLAHEKYASYEDTYGAFVAEVVPALSAAITGSLRAAVFTGPHIHEQRKPDAIGGIYCPSAVGRGPWGFKSFLPVLLYGKAPDLNRGSFPTVFVSSATSDCDEHPVAKPLEWMVWLVGLASRQNETILDPFAGSGTTGVAALRLGRRFIGIEKDPKYFALACDRLCAEENGSTLQAARAGQEPLFKVPA